MEFFAIYDVRMEDAAGDASSVAGWSLTDVGSLGRSLCIPWPVNIYAAKSSIMHDENAKQVIGEGSRVERGSRLSTCLAQMSSGRH